MVKSSLEVGMTTKGREDSTFKPMFGGGGGGVPGGSGRIINEATAIAAAPAKA